MLKGLIFTILNRHREASEPNPNPKPNPNPNPDSDSDPDPKALGPFRRAVKLAPSADLYADLGTVHSVLGDILPCRQQPWPRPWDPDTNSDPASKPHFSRKALASALKLDPTSSRAYAMMGRSYLPEKASH